MAQDRNLVYLASGRKRLNVIAHRVAVTKSNGAHVMVCGAVARYGVVRTTNPHKFCVSCTRGVTA